jgi:hypothetical protein
VVCAYLSATSLDGLRLFYAQAAGGNGVLQFIPAGAAGSNLIVGIQDTPGAFPPAVAAILNGAHFNVAFTALRPEDAQFVFFRTANAVAGGGFAYNPGCAVNGIPILSSFSNTNNVSVSCFGVSGADPISGFAIPPSTAISLGAEPVVLFYNTNGNLSQGALPTNILSKTATKFFSGQFGSSQSVFGPSVVNTVMSEIQREPLSGAYNAFEFQVVHARDGNSSDFQEQLNAAGLNPIPPAPAGCFVGGTPFAACTNPMFINSGVNSFRFRAISSSEMVKAVNGTTVVPTPNPDRLGYAFYGLQNFFILGSHLKYLTLQGMDPLYPLYAVNNGLWGVCGGAINAGGGSTFKCTTTLPSFDHIIDGNYRTWSILRAVVNTAAPLPPPLVNVLIQATQDQAAFALKNPAMGGIAAPNVVINVLADFVPTFFYPGGAQAQFFNLFRSHYSISGVQANNGTTSPVTGYCSPAQAPPNCFEAGGDMAGVGYWIISDQTYFNLTSSEVLTHIE